MNNKYAEVIGCSPEIIDHINSHLFSRKELALLNGNKETSMQKPILPSDQRLVKYAEVKKKSFAVIPPEFFGRGSP
jgi:hypothetical protein